jgi:ATP-binding protein involved in chromosome partitioning
LPSILRPAGESCSTGAPLDLVAPPGATSMTISEAALTTALATVLDPHTGQPYVAGRQLRNLRVGADGAVAFDIELGYPARSQFAAVRDALAAVARSVDGVTAVTVGVGSKVTAHQVQRGVALLPGVANIIAVSSGKGGVGKSTTAVNLALALSAEGARVGLLDADIYGPSLPLMMGLEGRPESEDGKTMKPLENHGVKVMSIGFLVDAEQAVVWRGPMATQALDQLLRQTSWGELDYLLIDMPPGTGDIALTLSQRVPLTGAVIVTTPQDIALLDARKGVNMFEKVGVPILGVVENMAVHVCTNCGHVEHIFGADGGRKMAAQYKVPYLGGLPLTMAIREQTDSGTPTVAAEPEGEIAGLYKAVARQVAVEVAGKAKDFSAKFPTINVSKST